jgi:hypothetical protein
MRNTPLAARGETLVAFDGRCIPGGCVAPSPDTAGTLSRRALPAGPLARRGATPDVHHGLLACALFAVLVVHAASAAQDPPRDQTKIPERGDTITVEGCLDGSTIKDIDTGLTFRLKGEKALIKQLGKEHKGHMDKLTGVLKSELRMGGVKGKRVGNTVISIGGAEARTSPGAMQQELNPVLEVKTLEHLPGVCSR